MNIEEYREFCLSIPGATECFPYNESVLVFKVMGKVFSQVDLYPKDGRFCVDMKCNPERTVELRDTYSGVKRSHYTESLMWNGVYLDSDVPDALIKELLQHSADEVIKKLPVKHRTEYFRMYPPEK